MHGYEHTSNAEEFIVEAPSLSPVSQGASIQPGPTSWQDTIAIVIPARSGKEYKLHLAEGQIFEYAWKTDGAALFFDFHGEPAGDTSGYFESFEESTSNQSSGSLTAKFSGTHGWYWKNEGNEAVSIELKVKGDYRRLDRLGNTPSKISG